MAVPQPVLTSNQIPEKKLDNLEEQVTITGIVEPIRFQQDATELDNLSDDFFENWDKPMTISKYEELNETNLLAAFNLPPRVDHRGIVQFKNLETLLENYPSIKDLIKYGPFNELEKVLQLPFDAEYVASGNSSLMNIAIESKNEEVIQKFIEHQSKIKSDKNFMLAGMQWMA